MGVGLQVDVTVEGRQVRFLNIIDEYTREALATTAARSFSADATVAVLDSLVATLERRPQHIRMDNGPEPAAHALADWCRFTGVDPVVSIAAQPFQLHGPDDDRMRRHVPDLLLVDKTGAVFVVDVKGAGQAGGSEAAGVDGVDT